MCVPSFVLADLQYSEDLPSKPERFALDFSALRAFLLI